jgi:hypothetical protein
MRSFHCAYLITEKLFTLILEPVPEQPQVINLDKAWVEFPC